MIAQGGGSINFEGGEGRGGGGGGHTTVDVCVDVHTSEVKSRKI